MTTRRAKQRVRSASGRLYTIKERARRILNLKNVHRKTLEEIGAEFLLSRERVRQILNGTGLAWARNHGGFAPIASTHPQMLTKQFWEANRLLSDVELAEREGVGTSQVGKMRHRFFPWSYRGQGRSCTNSLQAVRDRLIKLVGYKREDISFPRNALIDAGGVTIRVRHKRRYSHFWNIGSVSRANFVVAVCEEPDGDEFHFFVIPWKALREHHRGISISWPPKFNRPNKWDPYLEAWDLVRAERLRKMRRERRTAPSHQQIQDTEGKQSRAESRGQQLAHGLSLSPAQRKQGR